MKKYFFGIVAIALAVGFSAFTLLNRGPESKTFDTVYWFKVDKHMVDPADPISDDDATFLGTTGSTSTLPGNAPTCSATSFDCLVYFTDQNKLNGNSIDGDQDPDGIVSRRDN